MEADQIDIFSSVISIIFMLFLVFLNAFFVACEFSIVKMRRSRLEELSKAGNKTADMLIGITNRIDSYLSATQLGITFASLGLGWVSNDGIGNLLHMFLDSFFEEDSVIINIISVVLSFLLVTLVHVVLGELVPKSFAIVHTERMAFWVARPIYYFRLLFYPLIVFFNIVAKFFLRLIGVKEVKSADAGLSEDELKIIVGESLKGGHLDSIESEIITNAVEFSDTLAKEIMTPRKDMICLSAENSYDENLKIVLETNHTRYPYYKESKDNIVGVIHIRDLLTNTIINKETNMVNLARKMIIVLESTKISEVLKMMNLKQNHTALVVDEYGGTSGLLTMEDIIEEVMGDIADEHDLKIQEYKKIDENTYEVSGKIEVSRIENMLGIEIEQQHRHHTIGGYIFNSLGRLPEVGDKCKVFNCEFEVLQMDNTRIRKLKISKITPKDTKNTESKATKHEKFIEKIKDIKARF